MISVTGDWLFIKNEKGEALVDMSEIVAIRVTPGFEGNSMEMLIAMNEQQPPMWIEFTLDEVGQSEAYAVMSRFRAWAEKHCMPTPNMKEG